MLHPYILLQEHRNTEVQGLDNVAYLMALYFPQKILCRIYELECVLTPSVTRHSVEHGTRTLTALG